MHCTTPALALLFATTLAAQNQAIQLTTGVNGFVDVPASALLVPSTGITVEAWITFDDATVPIGGLYYWPTIARQNVNPSAESWVLRVGSANTNNRTVEWKVRTPSGLQAVIYTFAPGEFLNWTHLAGTYDGTTLTIFKNGLQVAQQVLATAAAINNAGGVLRIGDGDQSNLGNEVWNGMIDELRVWPFPRTAGEIAATMNQELQLMPGKALSFNLNGTYLDSSNNLLGTATGAVAFVPGQATLAVEYAPGVVIGNSSTTCSNSIDAQVGSVPSVGNANFAVWCSQAPLPSAAPLGLAIGGFQGAPPGQPQIFGIDFALDITHILARTILIPASTGLGNVRLPLPIPNTPGLVGVGMVFQFVFVDATCGPQGYSASNGIAFGVR